MSGLTGKVALVTGGSSGIGLAAATALARAGADVVIACRGEDRGERAARILKEAGGDAMFVKCDVSKSADVKGLMGRIVEVYGKLDVAFNAAGVPGAIVPAAEQTEHDFDSTINVNLKGIWLCMKHEILLMQRRGGGSIVNLSAVSGLIGAPAAAIYSASRHGIMGLTKSAALDYAKAGIRVNAVCAGVIQTPGMDPVNQRFFGDSPQKAEAFWASHIPLRRMGKPDEVAQAVLWLCSDMSSYVTGSAIVVDGGLSAQ